jgi:DNA-binding winged helix-turn-helix (wHTH) protein/alpha-beta hydrolase superfamily lysophospholipase
MRYLFDDYALDTDRRELRRGAEVVPVTAQVFDLLDYLIRNRERVVSRDDLIHAIWDRRIVSDAALTTRLNVARSAIGDTGHAQRLIKTLPRKGFRFVAAVTEMEAVKDQPRASTEPALRQQIHFCRTSDGVRLAYAMVGSGLPVVKAANWLNHLEYDWDFPIWGPILHAIAAKHLLIRYDERGNGLSDREVNNISFATFVADLESVIEAARLERFALLGISHGCATSIAYAARHPHRVSHLVIHGGFARGVRKRGSPSAIEQSEALLTLIREGWGQDNPAFRQIFTTRLLPNSTREETRSFNDLQLMTCSAEVAVRMARAVGEIDVTHLLPQLTVPTLVVHSRNDAMVPFEEGRQLAASIPGSRFVALESRNHVLLPSDRAYGRFLDEMNSFLRE